MSDLLTEVDEMMRQERMAKLWKTHGNTLIGFVVLTILATALISGYRAWNNSVKEDHTDQLIALVDAPNFPANIASEDVDLRGGQRGVALLTAAGALVNEDKKEEALSLYGQAAQDNGIPDDLRQLAALMHVRLLSGSELSPGNADLISKLQSIAGDDGSPWRYYAHLEIAALYASDDDYDAARRHLEQVTSAADATDNLIENARTLDHLYRLRQNERSQNAESS